MRSLISAYEQKQRRISRIKSKKVSVSTLTVSNINAGILTVAALLDHLKVPQSSKRLKDKKESNKTDEEGVSEGRLQKAERLRAKVGTHYNNPNVHVHVPVVHV